MATDTIKISSTSKDIRISDVIISGTTQEERDTRKNPLLPYRGFDYDRQGVPGGVSPGTGMTRWNASAFATVPCITAFPEKRSFFTKGT